MKEWEGRSASCNDVNVSDRMVARERSSTLVCYGYVTDRYIQLISPTFFVVGLIVIFSLPAASGRSGVFSAWLEPVVLDFKRAL